MAGPGWKTPAGKIRAIDHPARHLGLGVPGPVEGAPGHTRGLTRLFCHRQGGCFNPRVNNMDLFRDGKGYNYRDSRRGILTCLDRIGIVRC